MWCNVWGSSAPSFLTTAGPKLCRQQELHALSPPHPSSSLALILAYDESSSRSMQHPLKNQRFRAYRTGAC